MQTNKISVVVIAFNEEANIGNCIQSVAPIADEVIVVDSFSTDRTPEIAENMGAYVLHHVFEGRRHGYVDLLNAGGIPDRVACGRGRVTPHSRRARRPIKSSSWSTEE